MAAVSIAILAGNGPTQTTSTPGEPQFIAKAHSPVAIIVSPQGGRAKASTIEIIKANARQVTPLPAAPSRLALAYGVAAALAIDADYAPGTLDLQVFSADDLASFVAAAQANPPNAVAAPDPNVDNHVYTEVELRTAYVDAVTLIAACKIQFYKTNHHTGGDIAQGFTLKALSAMGTKNPTKEETTHIWKIGHWFDTRVWLSAAGVKGIRVAGAGFTNAVATLKNKVVVDEAAAKRIASAPAGTAPFIAVITAINIIRTHNVAAAADAPRLPDWDRWTDVYDDIMEAPAAYHVGAQYLTGDLRKLPPQVPDPVISFCATCIRYMNRNSTLAQAPVFKNVADDNSVLSALRNASKLKKQVRSAVGILKHGTEEDMNAMEAAARLRRDQAALVDVAGNPAAEARANDDDDDDGR